VESIWYANGTIGYERELIAPTGSTVAVVNLGVPIRQTTDAGSGPAFTAERGWLAGPHDRPILNQPLGRTHCVGIVTTPVGCATTFGVAPTAIRGAVVDLDTWWSPAAELRAQLRRTSSPDHALRTIDAAVAAARTEVTGIERVARAVARLEAEPTVTIGDLAAGLGVSHGHLDREFTRIVGLSPRTLGRILRMRRLLDDVDDPRSPSWSRLAAELGWHDQAHLTRDFKRHTGVTPTAYLAARRSAFVDGGESELPGFVPQG
jgi:AraC-like DNA-binding protein